MKWVIRIFLLIIGGFALAAGAGYFASPDVNVKRTSDIFAAPEDIFPYLANLQSHEVWSPWHDGENHKGFIVSDSNQEIGQQSIWICDSQDCIPGTEEIKLVQFPQYVQTDLNLDGQMATATYGLLDENDDGSTTILLEVNKNVGGFPYIQRLLKFRETAALEARLDRALEQLTALIEADGLVD